MATAISFRGECGFDYLELFTNNETAAEIVMTLESKFGKAWDTLTITRVKSHEHSAPEIRMLIDKSQSDAEQEGK